MNKAIIALAMALATSGAAAMDWGDWLKQGAPLPDPPSGQLVTGARLEELRNGDKAMFMMYVAGVMDGQQGFLGTIRYCTPSAVTVGQAADVVAKFLERYPQYRHHPGSALVANAMAQAFPCAQPPQPSR